MHSPFNRPPAISALPLVLLMSVGFACSFAPGSPAPGAQNTAPVVFTPDAASTRQPANTPTQTPTRTPTPTPPPTPTPLPATLLADAARAMHDGDYTSGIAEFQAALAGSPAPDEIEEARLGLGAAALHGGDQVLAENTLTQFIAAHPESERLADAWFLLGDTRYASGNFTGAADAYREYLTLRGDVIESYVQERIGDAYDQAGDTQAAGESYRRAIVVAPNTSIAARQREKLGMLLRLSGNYAAAIEEYRAILAFAQVPAYRAHVMQLLGQALIDSGDASGYDVLLELINAYPRTGDAYQALVTLIENGVPVDQFQRGLVDFYAGQYDAAVAAFDNFIPTTRDPSEALYYSGLSYRAADNPLAAITQFDTIIRHYPKSQHWGQAWIDTAIAQANGGDLEAAIGSLAKFVSQQPAAALAPNALLQAGLLLERAGEYGRAAETYRALQADYPLHESAPSALFAAGINAFRAADATSAIDAWRVLSDTYPSTGFYPAALLWHGKLGLSEGSKEARDLLDLAAQAEPFGYYGIRAAELRDNLPALQPGRFRLDFDEAAERGEAERWLAQWTGHSGQAGTLAPGILDDSRFRRGAELWRLGWTDQAKDEFESLRVAYQDDPIGLYALSLYWRDIGLYRSSLKSAARLIALSPAKTAADAPAFIARLAYPTYYADLVIPEAEAYGLDPLLMFALIRQESEFESIATSSAFANGLMQIIPATGREIAQVLGWPDYSTSDLYRPYVSVKFGAFYLARRGRDFLDGDMYAALAAYNGGPGNAARWRELANGDPDLFLEAITLNETRTYLIRIREHLAMYQFLYGEQ